MHKIMKPHKGSIKGNIYRFSKESLAAHGYGPNLGYIIKGYWQGHPQFGFSPGYTSLVVKKGRWKKDGTCEIETLNSRYTWVKVVYD